MKTNANSRYTVAVLIDGDNASFERMEDIMGFVSRYGDAVVRRIYGDWTRKALSAWKESAREHGFRLVQASSHVPGKNTTDIALVIDAMDILRDGQADCFCLVASDGDYSLLAQRIREAGVKVLGYGEGKTPVSLVRSCSVFLYADRKESKAEENTPEFFIRRDMEYFDKAFEQAADGKEEVSLSLIGGALKKMMPKFKVRRYGCKTLGKLYEKLDRYELVMTEKGVANAVRLKYLTAWQECSKTSVSPIHRFMYQEKLTFVFYTGMGFTRNVSRLR